MTNQTITVVSGLPRSGTSLMMQMLLAGGMELFHDTERKPDASNPRGYFEHRLVRELPTDTQWLAQCRGKAVKIISHLLVYLPDTYRYQILFMQRDLNEIIRSQNRMLQRLGKPIADDENEIRSKYEQHLAEIIPWLQKQPHMRLLTVSYRDALFEPERTSRRIADFLGFDLNTTQMAQSVDPRLYREKSNAKT